jgi:diadenosine tetraphosphate (Ap4A) HIT family hydrolase
MAEEKQVDVSNAQVVPRGGYVEVLNAIIAEGFCPFCEEHLMKHHPKPILFRSECWLATENGWPYDGTLFHFLLIPKRHFERMEDMSAEEWADLRMVYQKIVQEHSIPGSSFWIRSGSTEHTGASVGHLHANIVSGGSRSEGDEPLRTILGFKSKK